jgi:GNAT superfamily N-acetyltransferase
MSSSHPGDEVVIQRLIDLPAELEELALASEREGFEFVRRLTEEWRSGQNRFDRPGELLLGATVGGRLRAIGGVNRDHHLDDPRLGRLRHVYVLPEHRNSGVGSVLVRALLNAGLLGFDRVRLRAATPRSDTFYARLGFQKLDGEANATHAFPR